MRRRELAFIGGLLVFTCIILFYINYLHLGVIVDSDAASQTTTTTRVPVDSGVSGRPQRVGDRSTGSQDKSMSSARSDVPSRADGGIQAVKGVDAGRTVENQPTLPGEPAAAVAATEDSAPAPDSIASQPSPAMPQPDGSASLSPRVHAFYYAWYGNPEFNGKYLHWDHEVLEKGGGRHRPPHDIGAAFYPKLGLYSSISPGLIDEHMEMLRRARVSTIIVSWYPEGMSDPQIQDARGYSNTVLPLLFAACERFGLKISIHIEPYEGRNGETVHRDLTTLHRLYGASPALYRHPSNNKPLVYFYDSYLTAASEWQRVLTADGPLSVRNTPADVNAIGLWVKFGEGDELARAGFDGVYTYFATDGFTYGSTSSSWPAIRRWATEHGKLFVVSVGPGYNDVPIRPWNNVNRRSRENGEYYRRMFRAAVAAQPDLVTVTSFNEWGEGTQIEPAIPYSEGGRQYENYEPGAPEMYLDMTAQLAAEAGWL